MLCFETPEKFDLIQLNSFSLISTKLLDTDITEEEYIEFRSMQFENEKVVDKIIEDRETTAKQEVYVFLLL